MSLLRDRVLLKDLIAQLVEGVMLERVGTEANKEREEIIAGIVAAQAALKRWDDEDAKRQAFLSAAQAMGINPRGESARKKLKSKPEFNYDAKIVQAQRSTLENDLLSAQTKAIDTHLTLPSSLVPPELYRKRWKEKVQKEPEPFLPKPGTVPLFDVEDLTPFQFYHWNDKRWASKIKDVHHGFTNKETDKLGLMPAPGEARLAKILGGAQQGSAHSYDIVTQSGEKDSSRLNVISGPTKVITIGTKKWEVKGIGGITGKESKSIRPGAKGRSVAHKALSSLKKLLEKYYKFASNVISYDSTGKKLGLSEEQLLAFLMIKRFYHDNIDGLISGEVGKTVLRGLAHVITNIDPARLVKDWDDGEKNAVITVGDESFDLADRTISWSMIRSQLANKMAYDRLMKKVKKGADDLPHSVSRQQMSAYNRGHDLRKANNRMRDMISAEDAKRLLIKQLLPKGDTFSHSIRKEFHDAAQLLDQWEGDVNVSSIFRGVEGVFIVTNAGFLLIPKAMFNSAFILMRFSQGQPFLELSPEVSGRLEYS